MWKRAKWKKSMRWREEQQFEWFFYSLLFPRLSKRTNYTRFDFIATSDEQRRLFCRSLAVEWGGYRLGDASRRYVRTETRIRWRWSYRRTDDQHQCCIWFFSAWSLSSSSILFLWASLLSMLILLLNCWNVEFSFDFGY